MSFAQSAQGSQIPRIPLGRRVESADRTGMVSDGEQRQSVLIGFGSAIRSLGSAPDALPAFAPAV